MDLIAQAKAHQEAKGTGNEARHGLVTYESKSPDSNLENQYAKFISAVLPRQGRVCTWTLNRGHHWYKSRSELIGNLQRYKNQPNVYFGVAAYGDATSDQTRQIARSGANVVTKSAFYVDIDVKLKDGSHASGYDSGEEARGAIKAFANSTELKPSYVIDSGSGGLHVYWVLDADAEPAEWRRTAEALKRFCEAKGLMCDPAVTADLARVMRLPGTLHGKTGKPAEIITATGKVWALSDFRAAIGMDDEDVDHVLGDLSVLPEYLKGVPIETLPPFYDETPHADFELIKAGCEAVRWAADPNNQPNASEPYWRGVLGIAKHCAGADDLAHKVSQHHHQYDRGETIRKMEGWNAGPTTCEYFAGVKGDLCSACAHNGKAKSPITLGMARVIALAKESAAMEVRQLPRSTLLTALPDWRWRITNRVGPNGNPVQEKTTPMGTVANIKVLAQMLGWVIRYNVMTKRVELFKTGLLTARDDHDNAALTHFADACTRHGVPRENIAEFVDAAAGDNQYHPVRDWIEATPWDGVTRIADFHNTLELADPTKTWLRAKLVDAFMLQGIGAIWEGDGIAAQGVLTLNGPQDANKTRWVANLCKVPGAVRTGLHIDPLNKDSVLRATGSWISEAGELDSTTRRSDVSALKAFFTSDEDILRPAYARRENVYRRRTVFVGTVNGAGFLVDSTGNRRYWVIAVVRCHLLPTETMQQVWAEYLTRYKAGERWHLSSEAKTELNASNVDHTAVDPLQECIATRFDWASVKWDAMGSGNWRALTDVDWITATDVCMRVGILSPTRAQSTRVKAIVRDLQRSNHRAPVQGTAPLLERRSNGAKLLAVPVKRAIGGAQ